MSDVCLAKGRVQNRVYAFGGSRRFVDLRFPACESSRDLCTMGRTGRIGVNPNTRDM